MIRPRRKTPKTAPTKLAVVDIGSNRTRLAVYGLGGPKPVLLHEVKVVCRLVEGLKGDRLILGTSGMQRTLAALRRFQRLIVAEKVDCVSAVGTAAMRAAGKTQKGRAFRRAAEKALGHRIKTISGHEEAVLTATGALAALRHINGVCGDLGGGSLELARIVGRRVGKTASLPLGSLALSSELRGESLKAAYFARDQLQGCRFLSHAKGKNFYITGGSWRALGCLMRYRLALPEHDINGFSLLGKVAKEQALGIATLKRAAFLRFPKKIRRRADILPFAAVVLAELIEILRPKRVVFSGCGLREGLLASAMKGL